MTTAEPKPTAAELEDMNLSKYDEKWKFNRLVAQILGYTIVPSRSSSNLYYLHDPKGVRVQKHMIPLHLVWEEVPDFAGSVDLALSVLGDTPVELSMSDNAWFIEKKEPVIVELNVFGEFKSSKTIRNTSPPYRSQHDTRAAAITVAGLLALHLIEEGEREF